MTEVILFGGTTEGRLLAAALRAKALPALVCVATEYGESLLEEGGSLSIRRGRLETGEMADLFRQRKPRLVIDATHPFAAVVSENIRAACRAAGTQYLRVLRADSSEEEGDGEQLERFSDLEDLIAWLNEQPGIIFSTLGAKEDGAAVPNQGQCRAGLAEDSAGSGGAGCLSGRRVFGPPHHLHAGTVFPGA